MKRLLITIASLLLIAGCSGNPDVSTAPVVEIEREIPPDFITYASEGLFCVSCPPELVDDSSLIEEIFGDVKETMQATDPDVNLEDVRYMFLGHIPIDNETNAHLFVTVEPVALGMPLDVYYQYLEEECKHGGEYFMGFRLHSLAKTVIGGREAILMDVQTLDDLGERRSLDLYMIKDNLLWEVSCAAEPEDFEDYEDTFYSILSSFRILTNWQTRWDL